VNNGEGEGFWGCEELGLGFVLLERLIKHSSSDAGKAVEYVSLGFRKKVAIRDINMVVKAYRWLTSSPRK
jgi:hypothetical protein